MRCRGREHLTRAPTDDDTRRFTRGGLLGQSDAPLHVQQEVQEPERQRGLPGIIPAVAVSARCHARLLLGPAVRGQKGNYPPEAGYNVDICGHRPGRPGGGARARATATGLRRRPRRRGS